MTPYDPASNGQAERAVKIFKEHVRKNSSTASAADFERVLFQYRLTTHTTTGISQVKLLLGHHFGSLVDLARPDLKHSSKKRNSTGQKSRRMYLEKSKVWAKAFDNSGRPWLSGIIRRACGPNRT